jgi:hypothetical protein
MVCDASHYLTILYLFITYWRIMTEKFLLSSRNSVLHSAEEFS